MEDQGNAISFRWCASNSVPQLATLFVQTATFSTREGNAERMSMEIVRRVQIGQANIRL